MDTEGDDSPMRVDLTEAAKGADAPTAPTEPTRGKRLVQREELFAIKYVGPDGKEHSADVVSRIMDDEERDRCDRLVALAAGGPVENLPERGWRLKAKYTCAIQLREPPKWLLEAIVVDDDLLMAVSTGVGVHRLRYFRGDDGEGGAPPVPTHVEVVPHSLALRDPPKE